MPTTRHHEKIHALTQFFAVRVRCDGVILLTNSPRPAIANYPDTAMIYLLRTPGCSYQDQDWPANVALLDLGDVNGEFLKNKVFVCIDYIEDNPLGSFDGLSKIAEACAMSIFSVSTSSGWDISKMQKKLQLNRNAFFGNYSNEEIVAIGGRLTNINGFRYPTVPVLAIVSQYNEIDIIEPVVNHLLNQGVDVYVIDNWSNDGSYEAVEELARKNPGRVSVERFPKRQPDKYEWQKILKRVTEIAKKKSQYKWIISNDADEIRWSPWPGVNLQQAISFIDYMGFNITDYTVFNFSPVKDGYQRGMDPLEFFRYGDFGHEGWHFMQLKTWRNNPHADLASSSGHIVKIKSPEVFPLKFLIGHYPLRSNLQARKKVFQDRKPRFLDKERKGGWHSHYDKIEAHQNFISKEAELINFSERKKFLENYLVECLSGIGIRINENN